MRHWFFRCYWLLVLFIMRLYHLDIIEAQIWLARHPWLWR